MSVHEEYPTMFEGVDEDAIASAQELLTTFDSQNLTEWTERHTVIRELGAQVFRMLVVPGENPDKVIFAGGEFGNGLGFLGSIARLRFIQKLVDKDASIVLQPNSAIGEDNTNFSRQEKQKLLAGSGDPLIDRVLATLNDIGNPSEVVAYGPSQGGVTALLLGSHPDMPATATAVIETPNVLERPSRVLAADTIGSGADLKENISENFDDNDRFGNDLISAVSITGLAKFVLGTFKGDNRALRGIMRRDTAMQSMQTILANGGSVAHAWASGDNISPASANQEVSRRLMNLGSNPYYAQEIEGDHSITSLYLLNAALVNQAQELMRAA